MIYKNLLVKLYKIIEILGSIDSFKISQWVGSKISLRIHTLIFAFSFLLYFFGIPIATILLVLTTIVSLEAIYLSIIIQMTVNIQAKNLQSVAEDIDEIQVDVKEIQEDIDEIQEDQDNENNDDELLSKIEATLNLLIKEMSEFKKYKKR